MSVRDHQRARLYEERPSFDDLAAGLPDFPLDAALDDPDASPTHYVGEFGAVALDDDIPWTPRALDVAPDLPIADGRPDRYHFFPQLDEPKGADPRWIVDGKFDYHANDVDERTLRPNYTIVGKGGGCDSGGKAKAKRGGGGEMAGTATGGIVIPVRYEVRGLTIGELEFYHRQPGLAVEVLRDHVAATIRQMIADPSYRAAVEPKPKNGRAKSFEVYGLSEAHVRVLGFDPGSARTALSTYARTKDGERIRYREAA